eukprot:TRINITY_DN2236_c0_g4_i1.p1 TRINITY_DN2236_c0_g4~~TRINITY_DN2236_c0_g4_i1.p1  ORF type:complete len:153 (-),score=33.58 TRINITY_DN2236_c0_g4_i1:51-509(-)
MRRRGIPARCKHGQKLKKDVDFQRIGDNGAWSSRRPTFKHNGHSKSEFWCESLQVWIPVETVIRDPNNARKRIANKAEIEPHLVKYYDLADPTTIPTSYLEQFDPNYDFSKRESIKLGQLSNVCVLPIINNKLKPKRANKEDLKVDLSYTIE